MHHTTVMVVTVEDIDFIRFPSFRKREPVRGRSFQERFWDKLRPGHFPPKYRPDSLKFFTASTSP